METQKAVFVMKDSLLWYIDNGLFVTSLCYFYEFVF